MIDYVRLDHFLCVLLQISMYHHMYSDKFCFHILLYLSLSGPSACNHSLTMISSLLVFDQRMCDGLGDQSGPGHV